MTLSPRERYPAFVLFFPAAAVFAALAVPVWTFRPGLLGGGGPWHGHEMIFGFALAVVAGYLLTRVSRAQALLAFALWLGGRAALALPLPAAAAGSLAFPLCLAVLAAPPLLRAAKSRDNLVFGIVVAAFLVAEVIYQLGALGVVASGERRGVLLGVDLLALLLFAMGGRIVAAATSGAIQRRGGRIHAVAQPRLERAAVAALAGMALLDLAGIAPAAGALAALAAAIVFARLVGWRFREVIAVPEVAILHWGYAWLGAGLAVKAASQGLGVPAPADAVHGITVGALGTLTIAMSSRVALQRLRRPIVARPVLGPVALVSLAALARLLAAVTDWRAVALAAAAACWAAAFAALAAHLLALVARRAAR